jgi:hypothetical protein
MRDRNFEGTDVDSIRARLMPGVVMFRLQTIGGEEVGFG